MDRLIRKIVEAKATTQGIIAVKAGAESRHGRPLAGSTQSQSWTRANIQQSVDSTIKTRGEINLINVRHYVEEIGRSLHSSVRFPTDDVNWLLELCKALDVENSNCGQQFSSVPEADPFELRRDVVLSIKPVYSAKILEGRKTVELRRRFPPAAPVGALAYIYSTSPVKAMVGSALIRNICKLPVEQIWTEFESMAFIERDQFDKYFDSLDHGFALVFGKVKAFSKPVPLIELREKFGFEPPQSFLYAKNDLRKALIDEQAILSP